MRYLQRKARSGQTTAEYAIIVALVAVCSIAVIMIFGDQIRALIGAESQQLGGNQAAQNSSWTRAGATPGPQPRQFLSRRPSDAVAAGEAPAHQKYGESRARPAS